MELSFIFKLSAKYKLASDYIGTFYDVKQEELKNNN